MTPALFSDEYFMAEALRQAQKAFDAGEIPVGAVITCRNRIIAKAYNQTEQLNDVTAHAEMLSITAATQYLGGKYLTDCTLYVTLEPCVMCAGALFWSQISRIVIGAPDPKRGFSRITTPLLHPKTRLTTGILAEESQTLLTNFFHRLRT
ncbi:nucleoside deaminase [Nibrella saemangeumensis]|uniref:tRNA-specific adenosine deaminase n=1 Tax=Nibrella saemangeumensis TaxID=1084526 RepID=A0ABP8NLE8_9BACT